MNQRRNIPWSQISIEAIAIVASILLAFSIDAWWEDRQRQIEERQLLTSILAEFEGVRRIHVSDYNGAIAVRDAVLVLLRHSTGPVSGPAEQDLDGLIADSLWSTMASNYAAPALRATIDSGDLDMISNRDLKLSLAGWAERLDGITEYIERDMNVLMGRLLPYLQQNGSLLQILNATDCKPGVPQVCWSYGEKVEVPNPLSHTKMIQDRRFQGLLSERLMTLTDLVGLSFGSLDEQLATTIAAISAELETNR